MEEEDNRGLQRAIDSLEIVKGLADTDGIDISRADLWALAGNLQRTKRKSSLGPGFLLFQKMVLLNSAVSFSARFTCL